MIVRTHPSGALDINLGKLIRTPKVQKDLNKITRLHKEGKFRK